MGSTEPVTPSALLSQLELDDALPNAPFSERHTRVIDSPIAVVWPACLEVSAREVRTLGPLLALRELPSRLTSTKTVRASDPLPLLDVFAREGFVLLRRDEQAVDGRAVVLFGAVGRFWSIAHNAPISFDSPQGFLAFDDPDYAKTVASVQAVDLGNGKTQIETVTLVAGTDEPSTKKFRPYWMIIRGPSGLIRRSWLAAIDRRVQRS